MGKSFAEKYSIKHFSWICGQDARKINHYIKKLKPVPAELIALSDFLQNEFEKNHSIKPAHIIPLGLDSLENSDSTLNRDIDILGAGSLIPLKQFSIFLEMIYEIKKNIPGY